jgi:alkylation response protein AidB-like acyl-CoA dehydrogenase
MEPFFEAEHEEFRRAVRTFIEREVLPNVAAWDEAHLVDREFFRKAGAAGLLGTSVPEEYGGGGVDDFRFNMVIGEEFARVGASGAGLSITLHNDIVQPYLLHYANDEQKSRWLPGFVSGDLVTAIGMTEPDAGSDVAGIKTSAVRDGDDYVVNGAKTFITNGIHADLVVTAVKTDPKERHRGISLLGIERGMPGFSRPRKLDKIGLDSQDTAELLFEDVRVPAANVLGNVGEGFGYLMHNLAQERLSVAVWAIPAAQFALDLTVEHCNNRIAFGEPISSLQNTRFVLAELQTEIAVGRAFVQECVRELNAGVLTAEKAAMAKWWTTEMHQRCVDRCLQLHGGYGYMREYPISRAYLDTRVTTIYAGTTEIMKEIVGRAVVAGTYKTR